MNQYALDYQILKMDFRDNPEQSFFVFVSKRKRTWQKSLP